MNLMVTHFMFQMFHFVFQLLRHLTIPQFFKRVGRLLIYVICAAHAD